MNNSLLFTDSNGLVPTVYDVMSPEEIDAIFDSFRDAKEGGYYDCFQNCMAGSWVSPGMALIGKEGAGHMLNHSRIPEATAGKYYRYIKRDRRFTQSGRHSRVLVPTAARWIRSFVKGIAVIGFADFYRSTVKCSKQCLECSS
jgi:hypothetical protein